MAKYLIIECNELGDQWECDADRRPLCITDDKDKFWKVGYEIYEIHSDGSLELIKHYEDAKEEGFAFYLWSEGKNPETCPPDQILDRYVTNDDFCPQDILEKWARDAKFEGNLTDIMLEVINSGSHGEEIDGKWVVIGQYRDDVFDLGY